MAIPLPVPADPVPLRERFSTLCPPPRSLIRSVLLYPAPIRRRLVPKCPLPLILTVPVSLTKPVKAGVVEGVHSPGGNNKVPPSGHLEHLESLHNLIHILHRDFVID